MSDEKKIVTEEMHPEKEWFQQAKEQTLDTLPAFIHHLMFDYNHDYGTVVHAVSAAALAAANAADHSENGGITGFQAGFVMWDFVRNWTMTGNKCGLKLVNYDDFLFPQYAHKFEKTISSNTWATIQEQAKKNLEKDTRFVHPEVVSHWRSIVDGNVPFGYRVSDDG